LLEKKWFQIRKGCTLCGACMRALSISLFLL
jgi:hypothetical protein